MATKLAPDALWNRKKKESYDSVPLNQLISCIQSSNISSSSAKGPAGVLDDALLALHRERH